MNLILLQTSILSALLKVKHFPNNTFTGYEKYYKLQDTIQSVLT